MMSIQLITSTIHSLSLNPSPLEDAKKDEEMEGKSFSLFHNAIFPEKEKNTFINSFKLHLEHPGEFVLDIEYLSWFQITDEIDESFKNSPFVKINAPAIAYPYLRSVISSITLLAGFPAVILPTINFIQFNEQKIGE